MENRTPLKELPLINGREYRIRMAENGQPMITYGGSGILYFVIDENQRRMVIKELFPRNCAYRKADGSVDAVPGKRDVFEHYREAFQHEADHLCSATTATHHVKGDFEAFDGRFAVMREMPEDTQSLTELIPQRQNTSNEENLLWAISATKRILEAVGKLHNEEGILHLDLSLGNIFVSNDKSGPEAYILDFGNCIDMQGTHACSMQNLSYRPSGSAQFAAPELENGSFTELTQSADLFSIGLIFFHLLFARRGYYANKEIHEANVLVGNHRYIERALDSLNYSPGIEAAILAFILNATMYLPSNRYQTTADMQEALTLLGTIVSGRGMTPETLFDGSNRKYKEMCAEHGIFHYEIDKDLLTQAINLATQKQADLLTQNTILLGEGGGGKTSLVRYWWKYCLDNWKADRNNPIPIYVPLNTFESSTDGKTFIRDYIARHYFLDLVSIDNERRADLDALLRNGHRYIIFLDGINEAIGGDRLNGEVYELASIPQVKVCITTRNELQKGWEDVCKLFVVAELQGLGDTIIEEKLRCAGKAALSSRLSQTLRNPMWLALYLQLKNDDEKAETPGQILLAHHKHLLKSFKTGHHGNDWQLVQQLALNYLLPDFALAAHKMVIKKSEARKNLCELIARYQNASTNKFMFADATSFAEKERKRLDKVVLDVFLNCGIISEINDDYMAFTHQNYLEFYQAFYIFNCLVNSGEAEGEIPDCVSRRILSESTTLLLGDMLGEYNAKKGESKVEDWLRKNARGKRGPRIQIAVQNMVQIIKTARDNQIDACFDGLDLTTVNFQSCDLSGSSFKNAIVPETAFLTWGHSHRITCVSPIPGKHYLITGSCFEKEVLIWDTHNRCLSRCIQMPGLGNVRSLDVSPDGKLIAVCEDVPSGYVYVFRSKDGKLIRSLQLLPKVMDVNQNREWRSNSIEQPLLIRFADNRSIICASQVKNQETIERWDVITGKCIYKTDCTPYLIEGAIRKMVMKYSLSVDRKTLLRVCLQGEVSRWNVSNGTYLEKQKIENFLYDAAMDDYIIFQSLTTIYFAEHKTPATPVLENRWCDTADFLRMTENGAVWKEHDGLVYYDISTQSLSYIARWELGDEKEVCCLEVNSDGTEVIFVTEAGAIGVYNLTEGRYVYSFYASKMLPAASIGEIHFAEPNLLVRVDRKNCALILFDISQKCVVARMEACLESGKVLSLQKEHLLVERNDYCGIDIWNLRTRKLQYEVSGDFRNCCCNTVDSSAEDWEYSGICKTKFFPEDQKLVVVQNNGQIKICDLYRLTWKTLFCDDVEPLVHLRSDKKAVRNIVVHQAEDVCHIIGHLIVAGTSNGRVRIWNLDGECLLDEVAHNASVREIKLLLSDSLFVSIGADNSARIWDTTIMKSIASDNDRMLHKLVRRPAIFYPKTRMEKQGSTRCMYMPSMQKRVGGEMILMQDGYYVTLEDTYCEEHYSSYSVSDDLSVIAFYFPGDPYDISAGLFRIFESRTGRLLSTIPLFSVRMVKNTVGFANLSGVADYQLSAHGDTISILFEDGSVRCCKTRDGQAFSWDVVWENPSSSLVVGCDFTGAKIKSAVFKEWLHHNGAVVDAPTLWMRLTRKRKTISRERIINWRPWE